MAKRGGRRGKRPDWSPEVAPSRAVASRLILDRLGVVALPSVPLPDTFFEPHEHRL